MASEDLECIVIHLLCFFVICLTTTRIFVHRRKKVMEQHERRLYFMQAHAELALSHTVTCVKHTLLK